MWRRLRDALLGLWRRSQGVRVESRLAADRERFWAEVRQGQREAETNSRP